MPAVWPVWPNCGTMACPRAKYCSHHCVDDSCGCGRLAHAATGHRNRCAPGHWPAPAAKVVNLEIMFHITPHFFTEYNSLFVDVHNLSWAPAEYKHRPHTAVLHPGSLSGHKHLFAHLTLASALNLELQHWGTDSSSYWNTSLKHDCLPSNNPTWNTTVARQEWWRWRQAVRVQWQVFCTDVRIGRMAAWAELSQLGHLTIMEW